MNAKNFIISIAAFVCVLFFLGLFGKSADNNRSTGNAMAAVENEVSGAGGGIGNAGERIERADESVKRIDAALERSEAAACNLSAGIERCQKRVERCRILNTELEQLINDIESGN